MKKSPYIVLIFMLAMVASCDSSTQKMTDRDNKDKFYWSPGLGSANLYPMELYRCAFIYADGNGVSPGPTNLTNGSWGGQNGASVVGDQYKPVPVRLAITWLSYTENKFYKGNFELPGTKILNLFKQGFKEVVWDEQKRFRLRKNTYDNIIAGMAPGGVVVVWLSGAGFEVEVARFQAAVTTVDMKDFAPAVVGGQDAYVRSMMAIDTDARANLQKHDIPFGLWDKYRDRFNQLPVITYSGTNKVQTGAIHLNYYNGEQEYIYAEKWAKHESKQRARIKEIRVEWTANVNGKSKGYVLEVNFDEAEVFKAYKEVYGENPNQPGQLITEVTPGSLTYRIFLQAGNKKVELIKQKGEIAYETE